MNSRYLLVFVNRLAGLILINGCLCQRTRLNGISIAIRILKHIIVAPVIINQILL